MSTNCDIIVIFRAYGQFGAIWKMDSERMVCETYIFSLAVTFYLRKTENRTKKFKRYSLTISLKKGYIFPKSVDFL